MSPVELEALALSVKVAITATAFMLPIGFAFGLLLARWHSPNRAIVEAVVMLPLVLPPVVTGYALLVVCGPMGPVGQLWQAIFGADLAFRWQGAALAAGLVGLPLVVRAIRQSIEAIDPRLEEAAATLGASPLRRLLTVTLPLAIPGIISGGVLCFARSLGEFGATITFAGNIAGETRTLPLAIHTLLQTPGGDSAAMRLALISAAIAVVALIVSEVHHARRRQR